MARLTIATVLAVALLGGGPNGAGAQDATLLKLCADAGRAPETAARACRAVLDAGGLSRSQALAATLNLGAALLALNLPSQALERYQDALAREPASALALAGRADAQEALGRRGLAAVDWNRAIDADPRDPDLRAGRAAFRLRAGNPQGALADIDFALLRRPTDAALLYNRSIALEALNREREAEDTLARLTRAHPDDAEAWSARADLAAGRDPAAALAFYDTAATLRPEWPDPVIGRARVLERLGRQTEADAAWRRAWELGARTEAVNARMLMMGR